MNQKKNILYVKDNFYQTFKESLLLHHKNIIENIFITSSLQKLGRIKLDKSIKLIVIYEVIRELIKNHGTIFVPTGNINLCNTNIIFDLFNTPSNKMGAFSEYVRKLESSVRSLHPYWSVTAVGSNSHLLSNVSKHAYGYCSPWSIMLDLDTTQVSLGIHPSNAVTLIHHIETIMGVPYRYTKEFLHKIKIKDLFFEDYYYLSVFYLNSVIEKKKNLNKHFFEELEKNNLLNYS